MQVVRTVNIFFSIIPRLIIVNKFSNAGYHNKSTTKYGDIRYTNMFEKSIQIMPNIKEIKYDPPSPRYEKEKKLKIKKTTKK